MISPRVIDINNELGELARSRMREVRHRRRRILLSFLIEYSINTIFFFSILNLRPTPYHLNKK